MRISLVTAAVATLALTGVASAEAPVKPAPVTAEAGTYAVDPSHTQVTWGVSHLGFSMYRGRFDNVTGKLHLDTADFGASKVDVSFPTETVETPSAKLNEELRSADWLNPAANPKITFKSTKVTVVGANAATVTGDLTFHGVTKPVSLDAKFNAGGVNPINKKYTIGFELSGKLKRSEFGMKNYLPAIGEEVDLIISAAFEKEG